MDENIDYSKIDFEKASKLLDKKLTKEGVENAIIEIMQESKLSPDKQMSSINKLNDALGLTNIDPKSYTKDQADKGRGR